MLAGASGADIRNWAAKQGGAMTGADRRSASCAAWWGTRFPGNRIIDFVSRTRTRRVSQNPNFFSAVLYCHECDLVSHAKSSPACFMEARLPPWSDVSTKSSWLCERGRISPTVINSFDEEKVHGRIPESGPSTIRRLPRLHASVNQETKLTRSPEFLRTIAFTTWNIIQIPKE